jgi:hypothetical protein
MMPEHEFVLNITYGYWQTEQRMVPQGRDLVFESRKRHVSLNGSAGDWSAWVASGARLVAPSDDEPSKPWWKVW